MAALQSGEVDWWDQATADLLPLLRTQPQYRRQRAHDRRLVRHAAA